MFKILKTFIEKLYLLFDGNMVYYDTLTGVHNRNWLEMWALKYLCDSEFDVVFIDIKNFKGLNDSHGHAYGDLMLRTLSRQLKSIYNKSSDYVCRYGGDEFLVFTNHFKESDMKRFMSNIHYGISHKYKDSTLNVIIHRADSNMYSRRNIKTN